MKEVMECNFISLWGWLLLAVLVTGGAFAIIAARRRKEEVAAQDASLQNGADECYEAYIALEAERRYTAACDKCLGDSGLRTAVGRLRKILSPDSQQTNMATRIDSVALFLYNMSVACGLLDDKGWHMPPRNTRPGMSRATFLSQFESSDSVRLAEAYRSCAAGYRREAEKERTANSAAAVLKECLPAIRDFAMLSQQAEQTDDEMVSAAKVFVNNSLQTMKKYGIVI